MSDAGSGVTGAGVQDPAGAFPYERVFLAVLAASAIMRLAYAASAPLTGDELMHWQWARHLALGYPEHPPLVAWLIALSTGLFGHHGWSVRLVSVLAVTGAFGVAFRLGRELFGARSAFFGVLPLMTTLAFNVGGVMATTDSLMSLFWILTAYGVKVAIIDDRGRGWLLAGLAGGLCLLSKLSAGLLFPATLLLLFGTPAGRRWARRWEPYGAAALALALWSPNVVWNLQHEWLSVSMRLGHDVAGGFTLTYVGELLGGQLLLVSPILFGWALWGLRRSWVDRADPRAALLVAFAVVPFGVFLTYSFFARAGLHWPGVGYLTAFLAAGAATAALDPRRGRRLLIIATAPAIVLSSALFAIPFFPDLPEFSWPTRPDRVNTKELDNIFDWRLLGNGVQEILDREEGPEFLLVRRGDALANLAAFYTPDQPDSFIWKDPKRNGRAYGLWKREADLRGWNAVLILDYWHEGWFEKVSACFETLSEPEELEIRRGDRVIQRFYLGYGTNFTGFLDDARGRCAPAAGRQPVEPAG